MPSRSRIASGKVSHPAGVFYRSVAEVDLLPIASGVLNLIDLDSLNPPPGGIP